MNPSGSMQPMELDKSYGGCSPRRRMVVPLSGIRTSVNYGNISVMCDKNDNINKGRQDDSQLTGAIT